MKIMIVLVIKLILYGFIQLRYYLFDYNFFFSHKTWGSYYPMRY